MKKNMFTIVILSALMALTGCGKDTDSSTAPASASEAATITSESAAETTSAAESATKAVTTTASGSKQTEGSVQLGKGIFGGYVTADTAVKSKPDTNSDTLITIPDGTQIGVCESGVSGWFMTEFKDKTGYIPANSVREIQPYDPELGGDNVCGGSVSANAKLMSGTHAYAELLAEIPSGTQIMYYVSPADENWCIVSYQGKVGYVEAKYIKDIEDYDAGSFENPYDEYVGQWKSETQWNGTDFTIKISRYRESVNAEVSAHSAVADYLWDYPCFCSEDGTYLECTGEGTLKRTDYAPNGDVQEPVTVYSDGTATFTIKGGTLFWEDDKEGTARQVGFSKIG